jgi:hypothetical protein
VAAVGERRGGKCSLMAYQLLAWTFKYVQIRMAAIATSSEEFGGQRSGLIIIGVKGSDGISVSGEDNPWIVA